jgi:hypothetical protein
MTKKKKEDKKENPPPNKTEGRSSETKPGEDLHTSSPQDPPPQEPPPEEPPPQEISINEDYDPKFELLSRGIDAWIYSHFTGFFYPLTRAWAHFQAGTPLTTRRIFEKLGWFAQGDAEKMMDRLEEFKKFILEEYERDPNGRVTRP